MIYLGSDHGGFELKQKIKAHLESKGVKSVDLGVFASEPPADYPDIAREVSEKVLENHGTKGILICGTGSGMCMAANKVKGVRAANCESEPMAEMARKHNNANVLCLGGRMLDAAKATAIVDMFLKTEFEAEERHVRRVQKMDS